MNLPTPTSHVNRHRSTYTGILLLGLGVLLFHWRGIQPGQVFLPVDLANRLLPWRAGDTAARLQNWLISDPLYQFYPFLIQTVASLRQGQLLLWNPGLFSGHPALADPLFQTFYPFVTAFGLLFGPPRGFSLALVAHVLLASLLMFGFLRSLRLGLPAAVLGALTYSLSGYLVTWFEYPFWLTTLAWLPGILWAWHAGVERGLWRYAGVAGLLFGLALLAGQYQFLLVFVLFWAAYAAAQAFAQRHIGQSAAFPLVTLLLALGIGALIGAVQVLPFADLLAASRRAAAGAPDLLPIPQLVTLLLPHFFGSPALPEDYWGYGNHSEYTIYVGIVALFLAWLALFARPRYWTSFLLVAVLAVVWFAAGGLGAAWIGSLPLIQQVAPHRAVFLLPLLLGWLAASMLDDQELGWQHVHLGLAALLLLAAAAIFLAWNNKTAAAIALLQQNAGVSLALLLATAALLAWRAVRPHRRPLCDWLIVALVFANLFWYGHAYNPAGPISQLFPPTPVTDYLQQNQELSRAVPLQHGSALLFGPNAITDYGVLQPGGYSSLVIAAYHDLVSHGDPVVDLPWIARSSNFVLFSQPSDRLLDLLNVDLLVSPEEIPDPGPVAEFEGSACAGPGIALNDGQPLRGKFTVWHNAINRIDIPFAGAGGTLDPGAQLKLRLWRDGTERTLAVETNTAVEEARQQGKWTVYFAPETDAPGRRYAWELSTEGVAGDGLRVCANSTGAAALSAYGPRVAAVDLPPDNGVRLYRRYAPLSRASVVYAAETITDPAPRLDRILDPAFDVRNTVVVEEAVSLPITPTLPASPAEIVTYHNNRVAIKATAQADGLLVLADQYFSGWEATVDGVPVPVQRVNHFMRGVPLTAGEHKVIFTFAPHSLQIGAALSVIGLLLAAVLIVKGTRPRLGAQDTRSS
ncbi:MAG: YfhO family protein [Caldilineaceae bacterium]